MLGGSCRRPADISGNSGLGVDRLRRAIGTFWNVTVGWRARNLLKRWWPGTGLNPFIALKTNNLLTPKAR
jgi:hypothetical protein